MTTARHHFFRAPFYSYYSAPDRNGEAMWIRHLAVLILFSPGIGLTPHQGLARILDEERALQTVLTNYEVIRMEPSDIKARVKASNRLKLQLRLGLLDFRIEQRNLRSPRYRAEVTGEDGVRRQLPPPPVTTYKGTAMVGQQIVKARFTIENDKFEGVVLTAGDWHYIEPLRNYVPNAEAAELVVYKLSDIKPGQEWRCGVSKLRQGINLVNQATVQAALDTNTTYTVEIATEADYEYVQYWGSAATANQEIESILNRVEGVYEQELNLKLEIVFQNTWNSRNDPYSGTDGEKLLDQFREYWNDNFYAEGYDLAHLWTGRETLTRKDEDGEDIDIGGLAWTGVVCRQYRGGSASYGFSKRTSFSPFKFITPAHEIGHNLGAVHPDEEEPPIAICEDTIMQGKSKPGKRLTFCQFSRNEIRDHVSTYNSCLEAETETITVNPPSNLTAEAIGSSQIRLTWVDNSANEGGFGIHRRTGGASWSLLVWLGRNQTTFIDAGLLPASTYSYRMFAFGDDSAVSSFSNTATATTLRSDPGGDGESPNLTRWVIPTMANSPGREGAYYRTKVILSNFDSDLDLTIRLYGPGGLVARRNRSIKANFYWTWNNFLEDIFDYRGAGAVEFSGNVPFTVSAEVYTTSSQGKYTTVVHNGPTPLTPYSSGAASVGVVAVDRSTRTNVGVFNNSNQSQTVTARIYYPGSDSDDPDQTLTFSLPPKGWAQKSVSARGERGYILWRIPREAYPWVVSVDNRSNDGTLAVPIPLE